MKAPRAYWKDHLPAAPQLVITDTPGKRVGPAVSERKNFFACPICAEPVDMRDLATVFEHEGRCRIR